MAELLLSREEGESNMKKFAVFTILIVLVLSTAACQQSTEREVSSTSTTETTTVSTATVDTAAATDAAKDAAHETGTAMETAGEAMQDQTKTD